METHNSSPKRYYRALWILIPILLIFLDSQYVGNRGEAMLPAFLFAIPIIFIFYTLGQVFRFIEHECNEPYLLYFIRIALVAAIIFAYARIFPLALACLGLIFCVWLYTFLPYAYKAAKNGEFGDKIIARAFMVLTALVFIISAYLIIGMLFMGLFG